MSPSRTEDGFTLIELLVVMLIISALSAIALPAFMGQQAKAHDSAAKSNVRTVVTAVEACWTEATRYDLCETPETDVPLGTADEQVEIDAGVNTYVLVARSRTGNTFTLERNANATIVRTCTSAGSPRGGCTGNTW